MSSAESWAALLLAMPMLTEANSRWPATENGAASASWMRAATRTASRGSARFDSTTAHSSPPSGGRATSAGCALAAVGRTDAGHQVALAQAARDPAQRLAQQQVAGVVAELLVEGAESIEVDEQQREPRRRIAPRRLHQRRDVGPQARRCRAARRADRAHCAR